MTETPHPTAPQSPPRPAVSGPFPPRPTGLGPAQPPYKPLRRTRDDRIIAGVCGGVGRYFDIDPTAVRVAFALIAVLTWGVALLAYPVMWFLMPEESTPPAGIYPPSGPYSYPPKS